VLLAAGRVVAGPMEDLIRGEMKTHQVAGVACRIIRNGRPIKTACFGSADLEWNAPVKPDTVFEIGSVTKQFTAACILMLAEEGKLSVDDPISRYLPDAPPAWADVTLRHMLTHTSGITNYDSLAGFEMREHLTQSQFIARLAVHPLLFRPGDAWSYSNSGYNLLGYIIENVSGESYWDFLREHIFSPLQMTQTTRRDPGLVIPYRAGGYEATNHVFSHRNYDVTELFSAGAIVSTVLDLSKWNAALDGTNLLREASKTQWWTPLRFNDGRTKDYGFGWYLNPLQGHRNIGHSGSTSGFSASLQRFPDDHLAVILLSNTDELNFATRLAKKVAALYLPGGPLGH
jgi:D-alanyl-D-alanine carboxypeptidase